MSTTTEAPPVRASGQIRLRFGQVSLDVRLRTNYGIPSYESSPINFISLQFFIYDGRASGQIRIRFGQVGLDVRLHTNYGIPSYESSPINFISLQFFIYDGNYHRSSFGESKWLDQDYIWLGRLDVRLGWVGCQVTYRLWHTQL